MKMDRSMIKVAGVDSTSNECVSSSLDLFSSPLVEASIDHCYMAQINPSAPLSDSSSQISFHVPPSEGKYIDNKWTNGQMDRQVDG